MWAEKYMPRDTPASQPKIKINNKKINNLNQLGDRTFSIGSPSP